MFLLVILPSPSQGLIGQDDAGSGMDAANGVDTQVSVIPGVVYEGQVGGALDGDFGDWYRFEGVAGQRVLLRTVSNTYSCRWDIRDATGSPLERECQTQVASESLQHWMPTTSYEVVLPGTGVHYLAASAWGPAISGNASHHYYFAFALDGEAPAPVPTIEPPYVDGRHGDPPLVRSDCPGADPQELARTSGRGDPAIPNLVWAATKTGFRLAVAFTGSSFGYLRLLDATGAERLVWDPYQSSQHVVTVDVPSPGGILCFKAGLSTHNESKEGAWHAVRLANAFNDLDAATGVYTVNLLVSAAEHVLFGGEILDGGIAHAAEILWDASEGRIRLGTVIVTRNPAAHDLGIIGCGIVVYGSNTTAPGCAGVADYVFTSVHAPQGAAATYADAIQDRHRSVWMNNLHEGYPFHSVGEIGSVMTHELGHYAFGMMDLYVDAGLGPDCYDPATRISVMGGDRAAREFDDETTRCPNESAIFGYVPSWTLLRQRFPAIPERAGPPVVGPAGDGGAFSLWSDDDFSFYLPRAPQDDGGSGMDAPAGPLPRVVVQPEVVYQGALYGSLQVDQRDWFAFHGGAGQEVLLRTVGEAVCGWSIRDAPGAALTDGCSLSPPDPPRSLEYRAVLPADGTYYLVITGINLEPHVYGFAFGLDGTAPFPGPS